MRWDVSAQVLLLPLKKAFLGLFLLAPIAVVPLIIPYKAFRLAVSPTAVAEAYITENKGGKFSSYSYDFHVDGKKYSGGGSSNVGTRVGTVEYVVGSPNISRLTEESAAGRFFLWLLLFSPILGFCFYAMYWLRNRMKEEDTAILEVLRSGHCTQADILGLNVHESSYGDKTYSINYAYTPAGASERVTIDIWTSSPSGLGDEQKEDIVYLSDDPEHPVFLDALPGEVIYSESEGWVSKTPHLTLTALLLPLPALFTFSACLWYLVS